MIRSARELSTLIGAVYEAGLDPAGAGWPAALARLAPAVGVPHMVVVIERRRLSYAGVHYVGYEPDDVAVYSAHYSRLDPVLEPRLSSTAPANVLFTDALISAEEARRTEFDADWLRPRDQGSGLAAVLLRHGSAEAVLYAARARAGGPFRPEDVATLGLLLPHVTAAVRASLRLAELGAARDAACAALDRVSQPLLLVDATAGVHVANRAAEALLRVADGLAVEPPRGGGRGRLRAATPAATAALRRAVVEAAALAVPPRVRGEPDVPPPPAALALERPSGRAALAALAVPLGSARAAWADAATGGVAGPTVALFVSDPTAPTAAGDAGGPAGDRLRTVYRLTPAEAAVAVALAAGDGLAAVAAAHGVSLATVRTQAQHVYRKAGVRGQAALARLVERLAQVR